MVNRGSPLLDLIVDYQSGFGISTDVPEPGRAAENGPFMELVGGGPDGRAPGRGIHGPPPAWWHWAGVWLPSELCGRSWL